MVNFSELSSTVQRRSFVASATVTAVTMQVVAVLGNGPYALLYMVPITAIVLVLIHRGLGRPFARHAGSERKPFVERPILPVVIVVAGLGTLPVVFGTAGWPGAVGLVLLLGGMLAVVRTQRRPR
jgi:hypothetical protein